jgi:helicase
LIYDLFRWNGSFNEDIPKYEWEQMVGRAGRKGFQEKGYVFSCYRDDKGKEKIENKYWNGDIENVQSSIEHDDCLKKALLDIISINKGTENEILDFFKNSLFMARENVEKDEAFDIPYDLKGTIKNHIIELIDMGYIERKIPNRFVLTDFGRTTVSFLQTTFGDYNLKALRSIRDRFNQSEEFSPEDILRISIENSSLGDQSPVWLYPSPNHLENLNDEEPGMEFNKASATSYVVLNGWIENQTIDEIINRFDGKWAKYVKTINEPLSELLENFSKVILSSSKAKVVGDLDLFIERVKYGVTGNMVNFIKIKGFGRKTTINVYEYFKDMSIFRNLPKVFQDKFEFDILVAFKTIDSNRLVSHLSTIHGIGVDRAEKIFEGIDRDWNESLKKIFISEARKHRGSDILF